MEDLTTTLTNLVPAECKMTYEGYQKKWEAKRQKVFDVYRPAFPDEVITDYFICDIDRVNREDEACKLCTGVPCKKKSNQGFRHKVETCYNQLTVKVVPCSFCLAEKQMKRAAAQFKRAKIPPMYVGKTFEDYDVTPENDKAVRWAHFLIDNPNSMYFYGSPGVGKTFLASILAQEYLKQGKAVIFADVPSLLADLRSTFYKNADTKLDELMQTLSEVQILFLDDLGAEMATEWSVEQLYLIINSRYNSNRQTVVTSNCNLDEVAQKLNNPKDAKEEGISGSRIASRLKQMCKICSIGGDDRRLRR